MNHQHIEQVLRLFNLKDNYTHEELKKSYRELIEQWHPEKFKHDEELRQKSEDRINEINKAYLILENYLDTTKSQSPAQVKTQLDRSKSDYSTAIFFVLLTIIAFALILVYTNDRESHSHTTTHNELDKTYGYKSLRFGMTYQQLRKIVSPTRVENEERIAQKTVFIYDSEFNNIGIFKIDRIACKFFQDKLYRISLQFSDNPDEIYEIFKVKYGTPYKDNVWTRGEKKLKGMTWAGDSVLATILSSVNGKWDTIVLIEQNLWREAIQYEKDEPKRAALDLAMDGFKNLRLGSTYQSLLKYMHNANEEKKYLKKTVFFKSDELSKIGFYPLDLIRGEFFRDKLYRLDIRFSENWDEIFEAFKTKFPDLKDGGIWSGDDRKWESRMWEKDSIAVAILRPKSSWLNTDRWNTAIFLDKRRYQQLQKYINDIPKKAAEDL